MQMDPSTEGFDGEQNGDPSTGDSSTLRSLIRQELSSGLRGFQSELQDALRSILQEQCFQSSARCVKPGTQETPLAAQGLRQAAVTDVWSVPPSVSLPGSVEPCSPPIRPQTGQSQAFSLSEMTPHGSLREVKTGQEAAAIALGGAAHKTQSPQKDAEPGTPLMKRSGSEGAGNLPTEKSKDGKFKKPKKTALFKVSKVEEALPSLIQRIANHKSYEAFSGVLIIVNSAFLGYQTQFLAETYSDHAARNEPLPEPPGVFFGINCLFAILFLVELMIRWIADGFFDFFKSDDLWWNVLDVVVVSSSCLEVFMEMLSQVTDMKKSDALKTVSVIRVLRVVRIVRVARVIRVMRFFRELRMMIFSILGCVKNLMWVMLVLLLTFYIFGVTFTTAVCDYLDSTEKWLNPDMADLVLSFGTIDRSILSLFMAMSGGNDWTAYYTPLADHLAFYYRFGFLLFIVFSLFAVVNIVTGVFVQSALESNIKDKDIVVFEELAAKQAYLNSMQELFEEMDEDGAGTISIEEFEHKVQDERVIAYFNVLKLNVNDARVLYELLDYDHSGEVSIDEFLDGCYKLQGESRSLDMKIMQLEVQYLQSSVKVMDQKLDDHFSKIEMQQDVHFLKIEHAVHADEDSSQEARKNKTEKEEEV